MLDTPKNFYYKEICIFSFAELGRADMKTYFC